MAARMSSTWTSGTPSPTGRQTTSAAAPRATASGAKSCPSRVKPGTQKNRVPGSTSRLSKARPVTTTSGPSPSKSRSVMRPAVYERLRRRTVIMHAVDDWRTLTAADGTPLARYLLVERGGHRFADLFELHAPLERAVPEILAQLRGMRIAGSVELGRALLAEGARPARHGPGIGHYLARRPARHAPFITHARRGAPPLPDARLTPVERPAAELLPAFRAAHPPGHPDHD